MPHSFPTRLLLLLLGLCALSPPAWAQDFKTHYDLAMALYQAQKFEEAIPEFKAAYEIDRKPGLLFNIAQSYRKAGRPRDAIQYYDQYLSSDPRLDTDTRRKVDGYLAEARNTLASLELELKRRLAEEKAARAVEPPPTLQPEPTPPPPPPAPPPPPQEKSTPVYKRPWLWAVVGGVVVAGVIVGVVVGTSTARAAPVVDSGVPRVAITF
ncbi:MAG: tetratricopeptide repeat protein [Myxococcales bacterium]|nr:tetratricopeptide repeat protein [Myxococcales bacterium]